MKEDLHKTLTALLADLGAEDPEAWSRVLPAVYEQLKGVARKIAGPDADSATMTPTALVHDAWEKLANSQNLDFADRNHFFAVAAVTMRRVLIDASRRKAAQKRGGAQRRVTLAGVGADSNVVDLLELDEALQELATLSGRQSQIVELRFFTGLTVPEVAECLSLSVTTVESDWRLARAWLGSRL